MAEMPCTLGVDMGTTSVKAVAFTATGQPIAQAAQGVALLQSEANTAEQDPMAVAAAVNQVIAQTAQQAQRLGYRVVRLGISAAMHSTILVGADGVPLTKAIIWMDSRAQDEAAALWQSPVGHAIYARTGTPVHAMAPLAKLAWLHKAQPELFAKAAKFVSLKEWVWHQWFGEWQIDASIASATGLYNLAQNAWDAEALAAAGIASPDQLAAIVATTYTRTDLRDHGLLAAGVAGDTAFTIGASDGVLANLGVHAIGPDELVLTIGTSCAIRVGSPSIMTNDAIRSFCYVLAAQRFIVGAPSNSGGIVIDWLYHQLLHTPGIKGTDAGLDALVADAGQCASDGIICLPYLTGERAPLWDADASAALVGLRRQHTAAQVMRAAIEGIIFNAYWMTSDLLQKLAAPQHIIASGKVLATPWIRQLVADVFGLPVIDASAIDASTLGAAIIADIAAGAAPWPEHSPTASPSAITMPQATAHANYQHHYQAFRRVVAALTQP